MEGPVHDKPRTAMGAAVTLHYKRVDGPSTGSAHTGPIIYIPEAPTRLPLTPLDLSTKHASPKTTALFLSNMGPFLQMLVLD